MWKHLSDACLDGSPLATALQFRFVGVMFAHVNAKIAALLGFVRTVRALMGWLLVAALVVLVPAQSGLPAIAFATVTACPQLIFAALECAMQFRVLGHSDFAGLFLCLACDIAGTAWTGQLVCVGAYIALCVHGQFGVDRFGGCIVRFAIFVGRIGQRLLWRIGFLGNWR